MEDNQSFLVFISEIILNTILIALFILNLIWINKVMKYSNNKELSREKINECLSSSSSSTTSKRKLDSYLDEEYYICECLNEIYYKKCSFNQINNGCFIKKNDRIIRFLKLKKETEMLKEECDYYLNLFSQSGAIKTFNFEINKIYKLSKSLFIINIFGSFISVLIIFFFLLNAALIVCCDIKSCVSFSAIFVIIVETIGKFILFMLHLIYFILLARSHRVVKYKDFKNFSNCENINKNIYEENYHFLFLLEKNYSKMYLFNTIILIITGVSFCYRTFLGIKKEN